MTSKDERSARAWLDGRGLPDAPVTDLLVARLAARQRARLADSVVLAVVIIIASFAQAASLSDNAPRRLVLAVLATATVGLLLARLLIARRLAEADRRAGAALPRRAAHTVKPGWRVLLGRARAALGLAAIGVTVGLALSALTVSDPQVRQGAVILLVAVLGVAAGTVVQLRHLLTSPVVAEDETSLAVDVILRLEDARETNSPAVMWSLPVVLLCGFAPAWWNVAAFGAVVLGTLALVLIEARKPATIAAVRQTMIVR
ncbi:hypothetical protein [Dactylosporangium sp. NPDC000521]|uniref:hypothetical protein n=1 Tax=Dactylosporangium sp. NPDC000521 TaxID=3363975 RepID=UPI003682F0D6